MRDPNRIPIILSKLKEEWEKHPDLRLGQLILNLARNEKGDTDKHSLWNMEDETLLNKLDGGVA